MFYSVICKNVGVNYKVAGSLSSLLFSEWLPNYSGQMYHYPTNSLFTAIASAYFIQLIYYLNF